MGESITMTGSRFEAYETGIHILFHGEAIVTGIKADSQGNWKGSFEVPEMRAGTYSVIAEGESTAKGDIRELNFKIEPGIVLSPDEGYVGMNVTATGRGFAAGKDVVIKYDGRQLATAGTNDKGSFDAKFCYA